MTIFQRSELLRQNPTMENLYALSVRPDDLPFALYRQNGEDRCITRRENDDNTRLMARKLALALDRTPAGAWVGLSMNNGPQWFSVFWGLIMSGHPVLLLDANLPDAAVDALLKEAGAEAVVGDRERSLHKPCVTLDTLNATQADLTGALTPAFADRIALCTSGTTGDSRIFVYHQNALCEQVLTSERLHMDSKRILPENGIRSLAFLPYHHVFGLMVCHLWINFLGQTTVFLENRRPQTILETIRHFEVTLLCCVPLVAANVATGIKNKVKARKAPARQVFRAMTRISLFLQKLSPALGMWAAKHLFFQKIHRQLMGTQIDAIILGGSHTQQEHVEMLTALGLYTVCGFGMTETAITSVETTERLRPRLLGSVGRPFSNVRYDVIGGGQTGEMRIQGKALHTARLKDGQELAPALDSEGYYHTGDIVRLFDQKHMIIEGRSKEVIINQSGENVYPDALEDAFLNLDGVQHMSVLGLPRAHEKLYQDIALILQVNDVKDAALVRALSNKVAQRNQTLPLYQQVQKVFITQRPFPLANQIKVKRAALKDDIAQNSRDYLPLPLVVQKDEAAQQTAVPAAQDNTLSLCCKLYGEVLSADNVTPDQHFVNDLGGDSLMALNLSLKVEDALGVLIPEDKLSECLTPRAMANVIAELTSGKKEGIKAPVQPILRFEDSPEYQAFVKRQQGLLASGQENPYFVCHDSALFDTSIMDGRPVLNFGSYNYAGMSGRPETKQAAKDAIEKYGTSASGSRLLAGEKTLYQQLEKALAKWKHTEDCLVLVGGHSTNVTIVGNFCGEKDLIVYDALSHNSIQEGVRLSKADARPFPHNDIEALRSILKKNRSKYEKVLIVIEGVYSMDGDIAPVPEFVAVKKEFGCFLMVDEAHSACVLGATGGGVDEHFGLDGKDIDIKMGTLSKGLGACGGYIAGKKALIDYLRYSLPGFVFSVGISPPLAAATMKAVELLQHDPDIMARLHRNIDHFLAESKRLHFHTCLAGQTAIIPVMVGRDEDAFVLSAALKHRGVFVPPAVYPAVPHGKARLRFCVISEHKPEQITTALETLKQTAEELGIVLPAPDVKPQSQMA